MKMRNVSILLMMSVALAIPVSADFKTPRSNKGLYERFHVENDCGKMEEKPADEKPKEETECNENETEDDAKKKLIIETNIEIKNMGKDDAEDELLEEKTERYYLDNKEYEENTERDDMEDNEFDEDMENETIRDQEFEEKTKENGLEKKIEDHLINNKEIFDENEVEDDYEDEIEDEIEDEDETDENTHEIYQEKHQNVVEMRWNSISINDAESVVSYRGYTTVGSKRVIHDGEEMYAVYSFNPTSCGTPYLVHYVDLDGYYIGYEETYLPYGLLGDKNPEDIFDYMENISWSGTVILHDGTLKNVTVPVMKDTRTGMYYLGDVERKIAVADAWSFLYGDDLTIVSSQNNNGWYGSDLIAYSNYIKAYDFFKESDIEPNATLLLKNYVDMSRNPIFYNGYMGDVGGWTCFSLGNKSNQNEYLDRVTHYFAEWVVSEISHTDKLNELQNSLCDAFGYICDAIDSSNTQLIGRISDHGTVHFGLPCHINPYFSIESPLAEKAVELMNNGMTVSQAKEFWMRVLDYMTPEMSEQDVFDMIDKMSAEYCSEPVYDCFESFE